MVDIDKQNHECRKLIFEIKRQEALKKIFNCKFNGINTSNANNGYDTDNEVRKIQIFISEFNDKKIKENENTVKINKRTRRRSKKSKCINCQKMFYQTTSNEKHII